MAEPAVAAPARPVGRIVAEAVPFDDYLQLPDFFAIARAVEAMDIMCF